MYSKFFKEDKQVRGASSKQSLTATCPAPQDPALCSAFPSPCRHHQEGRPTPTGRPWPQEVGSSKDTAPPTGLPPIRNPSWGPQTRPSSLQHPLLHRPCTELLSIHPSYQSITLCLLATSPVPAICLPGVSRRKDKTGQEEERKALDHSWLRAQRLCPAGRHSPGRRDSLASSLDSAGPWMRHSPH